MASDDKPLLAMNDLEWLQAWDRIGGSLEEGLIQEAREGKATVEVAAAVLVRANGIERVVVARDEAGDGEGAAPVAHLVARARSLLAAGETIRLEMVGLVLREDGSWQATARRERARGKKRLDSIFDEPWVRKKIATARRREKEMDLAAAVLVLPGGARRLVFTDMELGDSQARHAVADLLRRARRLKQLKDGERLERVLVRLKRTNGEWSASPRQDPLPQRRATSIRVRR
jgi:hypothetical protein